MPYSLEEYFSGLYDKYVERIYRFIYLKVSSQEIAQDLSSEVFMRAWERISTKEEIVYPQAFLYQVARFVIADHYRIKRVEVVAVEEAALIEEDTGELELQMDVLLEMERVKEALQLVRDEYQDMVVWRYLEELSVPEIMEITGKSEENVRVTIYRALQALRTALSQQEPNIPSGGVMKRSITPTY